MSKKTTTLEIPSEYEDDIKNYLQKLTIGPTPVTPQQEPDNYCEVSSVIGHKVTNNKWSFCLRFKGYNNGYWVADEDCNCEDLISNYLKIKKLNTLYIVCRVSSMNQVGPDHCSLETQETELTAYLQDTKVRKKIIHITGSAYKGIPKKLKEIGDCANSGDVIAVYRADRFGRNIVKYMSWMEELSNKRVNILSLVDNLNYFNDKLEFIQKIVEANKESRLISKRIKASIKHRRERGDTAVGKLKYGKKYKRVIMGKVTKLDVVDDPNAVSIINTIKITPLSNRKIADKLNKKQLFKNNKRWTPSMVKYIKDKF